MKKCRKKGRRTSGSRSWTHHHGPVCDGPLVLVDSIPSDGATGVDRDIDAIRLVFDRGESHRHHWDDELEPVLFDGLDGVTSHHAESFHERQIIESIDMWRGFDSVQVTVQRVSPASMDHWSQWRKTGHWDRGCRSSHRDRNDRWNRHDRRCRSVFLVKPVSRLRADTEYKVRVKYLDISEDGCRKRRSAEMIVFTTGER